MKKIVLKLGGSLVSLSEENIVNYEFLKKFKATIEKYIALDYSFAITIGGGYLCRKYQKLAAQNQTISNRDLDWIGIASINQNAEILRSYMSDLCEEKIVRYEDYDKDDEITMTKPVIICAAGEPGHSSDLDAVMIAKRTGSKVLYRLTDVDAIYTSDPNKNPDAEKIHSLSWDKYFDVLGIKEFTPGGNYPIDPVAAKLAQDEKISFYVMSGNNLPNFEKSLLGESFEGSIVQ